MAVLIASELFTLIFAMNTLSSVRAFVMGEGLWTKAQKNAIHSLYQYALYGDERYYQDFSSNLKIPEGDHQAKIELLKSNVNFDVAREGFLKGSNDPEDVDGMIRLLVRFHNISYIRDAIGAWTAADALLEQIRNVATEIHEAITRDGRQAPSLEHALNQISAINEEMTIQETKFSSSLGAGSRWLEKILMTILTLTVLTIESTGLALTYRFSRNLSRSLNELMDTTVSVRQGDFSIKAPVHSKDELGQLAMSVNHMVRDLETSIKAKNKWSETLRKSEERFRLLVEAVSDYAIYMLDATGQITNWNSGAENISGYKAEEIIGKHFSTFYVPKDVAAGRPLADLEVAKSVGRIETDSLRIRKNGSTFWANNLITALHGTDGEISGFSKVTHDITERKAVEMRLKNLNEELETRVDVRTREVKIREVQLNNITNALPVLIAQLERG